MHPCVLINRSLVLVIVKENITKEENERGKYSENKISPLTFSTIFGAYLISLLNLSLFSLLYSCNAIFYNTFDFQKLIFFFRNTHGLFLWACLNGFWTLLFELLPTGLGLGLTQC